MPFMVVAATYLIYTLIYTLRGRYEQDSKAIYKWP